MEQAAAKCEHDRFPRPADYSADRPCDWGLAFLFARDQLRVKQLDDVSLLQEVRAVPILCLQSSCNK